MSQFDAVIVVSFGGPERPEDVMPFLENVTRGRNVPRERLLDVAEHYHQLGGRSPINDQNRALISALHDLLQREGPAIPIYWGNRNWYPFLTDTVRQMRADGVGYAAAFVTSAYGSYSGCRQYLDDIEVARSAVGEGAPDICRLPVFFDHPGFLEPMAENIRAGFESFCRPVHVAFTAHSIPQTMAESSPYVRQLEKACQLVAERLATSDWRLVYQSRSGPPSQPWLEPDICAHLRQLHSRGTRDVVVAPIGFISDHMEVLYDLDTEAAGLAQELGMKMVRASTVGVHPEFVRMIRDLLLSGCQQCAPDCCPRPKRFPT